MTTPTFEANAQHLRVLIANEKRDRLELLASVVIGGLFSSTVLRLFLLPVLYEWLGRNAKPRASSRTE